MIVVGIFGGLVGPFILERLGIKSRIARGLALGSAAHGLGTAKAMELGAVEGAISGLAIGVMGIMTAILVPVIELLYRLNYFRFSSISCKDLPVPFQVRQLTFFSPYIFKDRFR